MKYYPELASLGTFTYENAKKVIKNSNPTKTLGFYVQEGYVKKIKRNLYTCVDFITGAEHANKFVISTCINDDSYVFAHSAFEFYGFYNQVFNNCQVASQQRFAPFEYNDISYECFASKTNKQVENIKNIKITSLERTVIDSIYMIGKVMDLEELLKCLELIPFLEEDKLKEMLLEYDSDLLYRKSGYILSYFQNELNLSNDFFDFCLSHTKSKNIGKISNYEINRLQYIPKWNILAYKDLLKLISKGGEIDV